MRELLNLVLAELRSAWRFRWYGAGVAWVVALLGWAWTAVQPNVYEASARVYVDATSVLRPLLSDRILPTDVNTQLTYVRQALLGREHLERVARDNNLDAGATTPAEIDNVLGNLQSAIDIDTSGVARDNPNSIYSIRYRHSDRDTAVGVVTTLLNSLVEDTLGANREGTDTAERFLNARIQEYENRLQQAERALADFKKRNAERLPGTQGGYFQRMQAEREALEEARRELRLAESRRDQLVSQLNSESPVMPSAGETAAEPPPNSIDARIRDLRLQLDRLLLEYTERHPDVIATRESLQRLEAQRAEQLQALGVNDTDQELSSLESNPVHQAIRIALNEAQLEVATLEATVEERTQELEELQALIDEVPEVEAELARLNRDYDVVYDQYQALIRSRETQDLTRKASDTDQVEFRVIDPPLASFNPVAPDRVRLLAMVFIAALMAGGGVCYVFAQLKPVFTSARTLRDVTGFPVLGAVSHAWAAKHRVRQRFALASFGLAIGGLAAVFAVAVLIEIAGPGLNSLASML